VSEENKELEVTGEVYGGKTPVLPLRDVVVYPHMVIPLFVGREKSIQALDAAMSKDKQILLVAQKSAEIDDPSIKDVHGVGTLSTILQLLKLPDGTIKVLVEGAKRVSIDEMHDQDEEFFTADYTVLEDSGIDNERELEVLCRSVMGVFDQYVKLNKKVPPEILTSLSGIDDPARLSDTIAAHMSLKIEEKQKILGISNVLERLEFLLSMIEAEIDLLQIEKRIRGRVKNQMEKSQREYYLNEQMKAIQKELGDMEDTPNEIEDLENKIKKSGMSKEAQKKATTEINKLKMMSPMSAEATVVRNYLDALVGCPWKKRSKIRNDLAAAEKVLDEDHYGLEKVKERILEYLAVQQRVKKAKGPILCLVGPPGVGKTSVAQSIARATNRKFSRMALGGVRDEAEIRGHRRTYIGAMPGKIIQGLRKAGVKNPVFMLDELDKMSTDFRGDPSSALLEVLDPEQNNSFADHFLDVDYDLSQVLFIATANSLQAIPRPLHDRLEVIQVEGYSEEEKLHIARRYLLSKQIKAHGLTDKEIRFSDRAIYEIIRNYTRESGVRSLDRNIAAVMRKLARMSLTGDSATNFRVGERQVRKFLGVQQYQHGLREEQDQVGIATGLAWTETGGELLTIEVTTLPGQGKLMITGQLGDVMQESAQAALSYIRSRWQELKLDKDFYSKLDIHVHVPEGAVPKDGPSAGITIATALASALTGRSVRKDLAMTGEVTLRGRVLAIGGLKEKLLAARRGGITRVLIPKENKKNLVEVSPLILKSLEIEAVEHVDKVLGFALDIQE